MESSSLSCPEPPVSKDESSGDGMDSVCAGNPVLPASGLLASIRAAAMNGAASLAALVPTESVGPSTKLVLVAQARCAAWARGGSACVLGAPNAMG